MSDPVYNPPQMPQRTMAPTAVAPPIQRQESQPSLRSAQHAAGLYAGKWLRKIGTNTVVGYNPRLAQQTHKFELVHSLEDAKKIVSYQLEDAKVKRQHRMIQAEQDAAIENIHSGHKEDPFNIDPRTTDPFYEAPQPAPAPLPMYPNMQPTNSNIRPSDGALDQQRIQASQNANVAVDPNGNPVSFAPNTDAPLNVNKMKADQIKAELSNKYQFDSAGKDFYECKKDLNSFIKFGKPASEVTQAPEGIE